MEHLPIVPGYQPIPLPGPIWLMKPLILIGFFMHAIPMNVALVGGFVAAAFLFFGRKSAYSLRLGNALAVSLPFFVSSAITFGIVPLLFLQVVYGPLFYTSSILMAIPWLLVIILLLVGYYGFYVYIYRRQGLGNKAPWILLASSFLFLAIAFAFTNNMTLMLRPESWAALYKQNPYGGSLNWQDAQLIPRYLHFIVGSFAVVGVTIGFFGVYWNKRDTAYASWLIKTGSKVFLTATLLQIPVGVAFMLSLPKPLMMNYMGHDALATGVFGSAFALTIVALASMSVAVRNGSSRPFQLGATSLFIIIALMIEMRHLLREYMTRPFFNPEAATVEPQWIPIGMFAVGAISLFLYLGWLIKVTWKAFHPSSASVKP